MREEERAQREAELENIQDHIRFTKEHIDELTVKFARFKPPPQLYLQVRVETIHNTYPYISKVKLGHGTL